MQGYSTNRTETRLRLHLLVFSGLIGSALQPGGGKRLCRVLHISRGVHLMLDKQQIEEILPHRDPFLWLDRVL